MVKQRSATKVLNSGTNFLVPQPVSVSNLDIKESRPSLQQVLDMWAVLSCFLPAIRKGFWHLLTNSFPVVPNLDIAVKPSPHFLQCLLSFTSWERDEVVQLYFTRLQTTFTQQAYCVGRSWQSNQGIQAVSVTGHLIFQSGLSTTVLRQWSSVRSIWRRNWRYPGVSSSNDHAGSS